MASLGNTLTLPSGEVFDIVSFQTQWESDTVTVRPSIHYRIDMHPTGIVLKLRTRTS